jgi:hypothetical protein
LFAAYNAKATPQASGHQQPLPTELLRKGLHILRLGKAEHHEPEIIAAQGVRESAADKLAATLRTYSLFLRPITLSAGKATWCGQSRSRSDFALAAGHRLAASRFVAAFGRRLPSVSEARSNHWASLS